MDDLSLHRLMFTIRCFEETVLDLFSRGKLNGTTHTCIGQEANAVGLISLLSRDDIIWSNHRCHGHYLAFTRDVKGLLHELIGLQSGICGGKGGSQHLCSGNFFTNGVQGSIVPVAAGMALAEKIKGTSAVTAVFLGDGTLGEGVVYEAFNIASLWSNPILFVVENNFYAQTSPSRLHTAGGIAQRGRAFNLPVFECASNDVHDVRRAAAAAIQPVKCARTPAMLVLDTYRLSPHSKGDDFRDPGEIASWREKDPLSYTRLRLPPSETEAVEAAVRSEIDSLVQEALAS